MITIDMFIHIYYLEVEEKIDEASEETTTIISIVEDEEER